MGFLTFVFLLLYFRLGLPRSTRFEVRTDGYGDSAHRRSPVTFRSSVFWLLLGKGIADERGAFSDISSDSVSSDCRVFFPFSYKKNKLPIFSIIDAPKLST